MKYRISHVTRYEYPLPVSHCRNMAYLMPRGTDRQACLHAEVLIDPLPRSTRERTDYFGNRCFHFAVDMPHQVLEVTANSEVEVREDTALPSLDIGMSCAEAGQRLTEDTGPGILLAREYRLDSPLVKSGDDLREYAAPSFDPDRTLLSAVRELTRRIHQDYQYDPGFSNVSTPLREVMAHRRGVCQDFAHLAIGCLRSLGFPARYVSGYLETQPPPGQQKLAGSDESHAWFAAYVPGEGWYEFDPTNEKPAGMEHIVTAWGRDYSDVAPISGVIYGGGQGHSLAVSVDVTRL